jgi:hypothetical protein
MHGRAEPPSIAPHSTRKKNSPQLWAEDARKKEISCTFPILPSAQHWCVMRKGGDAHMTEPSAVKSSAESPRYREAFNRLKEEFRAIPADQLLTLNIEPLVALTTLLTSLPAIKGLQVLMQIAR